MEQVMTESEKIEMLLRPRWKVTNIWPDMGDNQFFEGEIIELNAQDEDCSQWKVRRKDSTLYDAFFENYPHLFKRLEWWEEREISALPQYIKESNTGKIGKVFEWHCIGGTTFFVLKPYTDLQKAKWFNPDFFTPATHKQYLDYIAPTNLSA